MEQHRRLSRGTPRWLLRACGPCERWRYRLETTSCEDDVLYSGRRWVSDSPESPEQYGVKVFKDIVTRQKVLTLASMRPIHQICLEAERLQVARALTIAERFCQPSRFLSLRVDEVFLDIPKRDRPKFKEYVTSVTYAKLYMILPRGRAPTYQKASHSHDPVYKVKAVEKAIMPGGEVKLCEAVALALQELTWRVTYEPAKGLDNFVEQTVVPHVVSGGSCCLEGAAGTSKTQALLAVKAALEAKGLH